MTTSNDDFRTKYRPRRYDQMWQGIDHPTIKRLRREVASLLAELQHHRNEQAATAEAFAAVLGQLSDLQKPLTEVHRRLQSVHAPAMNGAYSHA